MSYWGIDTATVVQLDMAKTEAKEMYVYIRSEPGLYTVGFYHPDGTWEPESDHSEREQAAERVAYLNGARED